MKKFLLIAAALTAVACSQMGRTLPQGLQSIEVSTESGRIGMKDGVTVWNSGDKVSVFYKSEQNELWTYAGSDGSTSGVIRSAAKRTETGSDIIALYPYNREASLAGSVVSTEIPVTQNVREASFGKAAAVMVARSSEDALSFRFATAFVALEISGPPASFSSIELSSTAGEKLAGPCTVDLSAPVPAVSATGVSSVTLKAESGDINFNGGRLLLLAAVAPGTYVSGFEVVFNLADGGRRVVRDQMNVTLTPGHAHSIDCSLVTAPCERSVSIPFIADGHGYSPFSGVTATQGTAKVLTDRTFALNEYPGLLLEFKVDRLRLIWGSNNGLEVIAAEGDYVKIPALDGYRLNCIAVSANGSRKLDFEVADEDGKPVGADVLMSGESLYFCRLEDSTSGKPYLMKFAEAGSFSCITGLNFRYILER